MKAFAFSLSTALLLAAATASTHANAQVFEAVRLNSAAPGQDGGTIGLALMADQAYQGSNQRRNSALPLIDYQWASGWFAGTSNGIGYNFSRQPELQYGARLTADLGRPSDRATALNGMGDIEARPELGAFFNYRPHRDVALSASLRHGAASNRRGTLLDLGASYSTEIAPQWRAGAGIATTLANASYLQSYFGVSAAQAGATGYAAYAPDAGVRDTRVDVSLTYFSTPRIFITTGLRVSTLGDQAKNSPITRESTSTSALIALGYAF